MQRSTNNTIHPDLIPVAVLLGAQHVNAALCAVILRVTARTQALNGATEVLYGAGLDLSDCRVGG